MRTYAYLIPPSPPPANRSSPNLQPPLPHGAPPIPRPWPPPAHKHAAPPHGSRAAASRNPSPLTRLSARVRLRRTGTPPSLPETIPAGRRLPAIPPPRATSHAAPSIPAHRASAAPLQVAGERDGP